MESGYISIYSISQAFSTILISNGHSEVYPVLHKKYSIKGLLSKLSILCKIEWETGYVSIKNSLFKWMIIIVVY